MKICEKCGKEIADGIFECQDCVAKAQAYEHVLKNAKIMNIIALALMVSSIICALFLNTWLGAVLCLGAEIVCLIPNTKIQKLFKQKSAQITDNKNFKMAKKTLVKELKSKNKDYKFSFIIALVALFLLIAFVVCDSVLLGWAKSLPNDLQKDSYGSGFVNQIDTIGDLYQYANSKFYNYSHNSSNSQSTPEYAESEIVGDYWLYETSIFVHPATNETTKVQPINPYITGFQFKNDGTGAVICETNNGTQSYNITWREPANSETETTKCYMVEYNNKTVFLFYHKEKGYCFTSESDIVTYYYQYSE